MKEGLDEDSDYFKCMEILTENIPSLLIFIKIGILIILLIYIAFATVVVRQVKVMTHTLEVGFEKPVIIISYIHLAVSIGVFIFSIIFL